MARNSRYSRNAARSLFSEIEKRDTFALSLFFVFPRTEKLGTAESELAVDCLNWQKQPFQRLLTPFVLPSTYAHGCAAAAFACLAPVSLELKIVIAAEPTTKHRVRREWAEKLLLGL